MEEAPIGDNIAVKDTAQSEILNEEDKGQTTVLINKVLKSESVLFHDQFGSAFIAMDGNGGKILRLRNREFKSWLSHLGWKSLGKPINSAIIETAVRTLEGHALHEGKQLELHVRAANLGNELWYDLGDGKAVKITEHGWQVVEKPPILFYRFAHQKAQVTPVEGGELEEVFDFIPEPAEQKERLLLLIWLATALIQGFPHPILVVKGEKGSRKTTLFKLLRRLLDPSMLETVGPQRDLNEFIQQASHNYFLPLDNLSPIKSDFSDLLCRVVTGEGFSKRELFTNDDDIIYSFQRVLGMNGINLPIDKPDILDRALIVNLQPPENYEDEKKLFARFEEARPRLLGALFTLIAQTMKYRQNNPTIEGLEQYRMAGFAQFGAGASEVLGIGKGDFISALKANRQLQHDEVIETSSVAFMIMQFMKIHTEWQGTPTALLTELKDVADGIGLDKQKVLPKQANWLWRKLEEVIPNLRERGIIVTRDRGDGLRNIQITTIAVTPSVEPLSNENEDISSNEVPF